MSSENLSLKKEIKKILKELNIPFHLQGYDYLIDVVLIMLKHNWDTKYLTPKIYPLVAKKHETNARTVERSIRYAIKWQENIMSKVSKKHIAITEDNNLNGLTYSFYGKRTNSKIIMSILNSVKSVGYSYIN